MKLARGVPAEPGTLGRFALGVTESIALTASAFQKQIYRVKIRYMKTISVKTGKREEMLDITGEVRKALAEALSEENHPVGETPPPLLRKEGSLILFVQHTTCGLTVNENADPDVKSDMLGWLRRSIPQYDPEFKHYEHNSDAHIKASLMGPSVTVPFAGGELMLGPWQGIYLCEFDGPRERQVLVKVLM